MQATMLGIIALTLNQYRIVPYRYVSAGNPITVIADMYVAAIDIPTGICGIHINVFHTYELKLKTNKNYISVVYKKFLDINMLQY